jgi:hypothetical protein
MNANPKRFADPPQGGPLACDWNFSRGARVLHALAYKRDS